MIEEEIFLDEPQWFCLRSQPKHEHIAARVLRSQFSLEVFCPRIRFKKKTVRGIEWRIEPLFPNYLFARYNPMEHQVAVRYAFGVSSIISFGGKSRVVEPWVIEDLRSHFDDQEIKEIPDTMQQGDTAIVADGPMQGLTVVVTQVMPSKERVKVLLEFLGRQSEVEFPRSQLIRAGNHPLAVPQEH